MPKDIVCGMEIDKNQAAAISKYQDLTFYFCAEACKNIFDAEPEKYIKRLNWWKRFLLRLGDASKRTYGNEPPKCCK
ncbi:MAG: YHS domain-containing protein [Nitrospirae bacterium]|nr:YHS domain-containing protein [Nitrospirota bacterium]